ncbi:L-2,4-diaminobutyrate decarboxylase [Neisseria sp. HSC-16F19]|nr:pyridoxal-dependent decarboxylase [Neisseria sp. HSC-16F19]MCP2040321.1 L-2,4-diaminobutyrate decarboxylase [Neisseria sp. HSC-16F19]
MSTAQQTLLCAHSATDYRQQMQTAVDAVALWLRDPQLYPGGSLDELRARIRFQGGEHGLGLPEALARAVDTFLHNSLKVHHPLSVAHLHCPTLLASQVAEVLINAANQSMDSWDQSPAASLMEIELVQWLCRLGGYGSGSGGVFTSGGTQSNLMGLLLARDAWVARHWQDEHGAAWSVQERGLPPEALSRLKVLCSEQAHFSVQKSMALLGLGFQAVVAVASDAEGRMDTAALAQCLADMDARGDMPFCVVATAGSTDAGAIDPLSDIRSLCNAYGNWLHVDAAWGGALLLSAQHRARLAGLETADSVTLDFHKQFFQSISCGAFLLSDAAHFRLLRYQAEYLNSAYDAEHGVPNLVDYSLQTTRRFDALKLWLSVEALGTEAYGALIDHGVRLAQQAAALIEGRAPLQLLLPPQLASVLFRLAPPGLDDAAADQLNQTVADALFARGVANMGVTEVRGRRALKLTLLNPTTTLDDVAALLDTVCTEAAL